MNIKNREKTERKILKVEMFLSITVSVSILFLLVIKILDTLMGNCDYRYDYHFYVSWMIEYENGVPYSDSLVAYFPSFYLFRPLIMSRITYDIVSMIAVFVTIITINQFECKKISIPVSLLSAQSFFSGNIDVILLPIIIVCLHYHHKKISLVILTIFSFKPNFLLIDAYMIWINKKHLATTTIMPVFFLFLNIPLFVDLTVFGRFLTMSHTTQARVFGSECVLYALFFHSVKKPAYILYYNEFVLPYRI